MSSARRDVGSIAARLTVLYALLSAAVLIVAAFSLYWMLQANLRREGNLAVAEEIHIIRQILRVRPDDPTMLRQEVRWEAGDTQAERTYDRVLTVGHREVIATPGMAAIPSALFPPPVPVNVPVPRVAVLRRLSDGRSLRLLSAWASLGPGPGPAREVEVAVDVTRAEGILAAYRTALWMVVALGVAASGAAGLWVSRKGLEPLSGMVDATRRITAERLHERLATEPLPSELVPLAQAVNDMLVRLERAFARLNQFSADLAHELRTPINNLRGECEVTLDRPRGADEYRQVLESALEEYGRLSRMIDGLLFLARADAGVTPRREHLSGASEIAAVCEFYEALALEQGVALRASGDTPLWADPILLRRALTNLLSNALRYTPRGGEIRVTADLRDGMAEITVTDNGRGIARHHLPHLFDRFYRADERPSERSEGFGLGLSLVRSIMELHGGRVVLDSEEGVGTTVRLYWPDKHDDSVMEASGR